MTRAAIYARISSDPKGLALGVTRQETACRELCDRRGWEIAGVWTDNDVSAYSRKPRPAWADLLHAIKAREVDVLVAWHPDRLTRHTRELEDLIDLVEASGVEIATVAAGEYDLSTPNGRGYARMGGVFARIESEQKATRLRAQRRQAAEQGRYQGGRRAFGYEPDGMQIRESEAAIVREMADRFLAGETIPRLCDELNRRKIGTASGGQWRVTSLRTVLAGPRIAGLRTYQGEIVADAAWPPILDRTTWERIRAVIGDPRRRRGGRPPARLLTGLVRCGQCGGAMYASSGANRAPRYMCWKSPGSVGCGRRAVQAEHLEREVVDQVLAVLDGPALIDRIASRGAEDHTSTLVRPAGGARPEPSPRSRSTTTSASCSRRRSSSP